jgi:hypothetical protein
MIIHTVVFRMKHATGSAAEKDFIEAAKRLATIPSAENLRVMKQTSPKAPYSHCLWMEFANQAAYDAYWVHPDHVAFGQRWDREVADHLVLDYATAGRNPLPRPRPGGSAAEAIRPRIPQATKARR